MIGDIDVVKCPGSVRTYKVDDRTSSSAVSTFEPGEPVKRSTYYATFMDSDDPSIGTDEMIGVVSKESTETSTVDGEVEVITLIPGQTVLRAKAATAANIDTAAELLTYLNSNVLGEWSSGYGTYYYINEDSGNDPNLKGYRIVDGDYEKTTLDVIVHINCTEAGTLVGQTID